MKKSIYLLIIAWIAALAAVYAQPISGYGFETKTATYSEITGGTIVGAGLSGDQLNNMAFNGSATGSTEKTTAAGFPIGFDFLYNDVAMNKFAIAAGGFIVVGKDQVTIDPGSSGFVFGNDGEGKQNIIGMAMNATMLSEANTEISYKLAGSAPNRILTVQYKNVATSFFGNTAGTFNFQIRLYEAGSKIEYSFRGWSGATRSMDVRIGLKGNNNDLHLRYSDDYEWNNTAKYTEDRRMNWSADNYPADNLVYVFTPVADCLRPPMQPTELTLTATSVQIEGSFTASAVADHSLVVMTETPTLSQNPVDKTYYKEGDALGNGKVITFTTGTTFTTPNDLAGYKTYYFHIFAVNSYCMHGPLYNTAVPLTGQISTLPMLPESLEQVSVEYNTAKIKVTANNAGQQVVVAMTDQYGLSQYGDVQLIGAFGNPEGELNVNDEITGGGRVIYKGSSTDNISISNLTENTIYHFRAWSVDDNNNYSSTNLNTSILTWAKVPYYPPFDKMPKFDMPFGWEREGTAFRLSQSSDKSTFQLECNNTAGDAINGKLNSITTPWILLGEGTNRVVFDANFTTWTRPTGTLPYNDWDERDVLQIQVSTDGENFITVQEITKENAPQLENANYFAPLSFNFTQSAGEKVKIKVRWHCYAGTSPKMIIQNFLVEQKPDCEYPTKLSADPTSIVGGTALLSWLARGEESMWDIRYRISGTEEWSEPLEVTENPYLHTSLPERSTVEVQVRAKCGMASFSPWSKSITFTTGYNLPYTETFDENELPLGWETQSGQIANPTEFCSGLWCKYYWQVEDNKLTIDYNESLQDWIMMPLIDLTDGAVHYKLEFDLGTIHKNNEQAVGEPSLSVVISSEDGTVFTGENILKKLAVADGIFNTDGKNQHYIVDLSEYKGKVKIAFYAENSETFDQQITLDNIGIIETCPPAYDAKVENLTNVSAKITWEGEADEWLVFSRKKGETTKTYQKQAEKELNLTGLEERTAYEVGITKSCTPGDTARIVMVAFTTLSEAPCLQVTDIAVTTTQYSARIGWTGEGIRYNIKVSKQGADDWTNRNTANSYIVLEGLDPETAYEYAIQTVCSDAEGDISEWTTISTFTTLAVTCFPPTEVTVTPAHHSATVSWNGDANKYQLAYRESNETEWNLQVVENKTNATIDDLKALTNYTLRMRSICAVNDTSLWTSVVEFKTTDVPPCVIPSNLRATEITDTTAELAWDADDSNVSWNLRYRMGSVTSWTTVNDLTKQSYSLQGLTPGTAYLWTVRAVCDDNKTSSWAAQEEFTTQGEGIESARKESLKVFVSGQTINILNPERIKIERIQLYGASGKLLDDIIINSTDNVFIPHSMNKQVVILKIYTQDFHSAHTLIIR